MTEDELILTSVLNCRRLDLYSERPALSPEQRQLYESIRKRRAEGEPLQQILGEWEFMGLYLTMSPGVFIPRPETELLVAAVLDHAAGLRSGRLKILELGTGSGNMAVSLAKLLPLAEIVTVDISRSALELAMVNARHHEVQERIDFRQADMKVFLAAYAGPAFDLIVSNPPYIPSGEIERLSPEVRHDPRPALDGGKDGFDFLRLIVERGAAVLKPYGRMFLEIGDGQAEGLRSIVANFPGYGAVHFINDYLAMERVAMVEKIL